MKLSISNIGWEAPNDNKVYALMQKYGYEGLEIAPTRIFPDTPYDNLMEATKWKQMLTSQYGFIISSMQSIWYGRTENLFQSKEEREILIEYTKKAINFASVIGCKNLVFGCPKNRVLSDITKERIGIEFFKEIGDYAADVGTVIGMEANPTIYNTNYINDTVSALELIRNVNSKGFLLNLDVGTMIQNEENISELEGNIQFINHVHISEPGLKAIMQRELHKNLYALLEEENYKNFVSIEMGKVEDLFALENVMDYVRGIFD